MDQYNNNLPCNSDAEKMLISRMLLNADIIPLVANVIQDQHFYFSDTRILFRAIIATKNNSLPAILQYIADRKLSVSAGVIDEIVLLAASSVGWKTEAEIILDLAKRRDLILSCSSTARSAQVSLQDGIACISDAIKKIMQNSTLDPTNEELLQQSWETIERRHADKTFCCGVNTGFMEIDSKTNGMEPKTTWYVGALRSTGKSAFAINICENILTNDINGLIPYFSLESTHQALTFRRIARESKIHLTRIKTGNIFEDEWPLLGTAYQTISQRKLIFYDQYKYRYLENIMSQCEVLRIDNNVPLVVIDYLQLVTMNKTFHSKIDRFSEISDTLNWFAKEMNCPVMILSQLNADEQLKESRDIENNADNIWILRKMHDMSSEVKLTCVKGKDTGTFTANLIFDGGIMLFSDAG